MSVVIETTIGDLTIDLFVEERPTACLNFMKLCKLKYYNYNLFHTIEQGFIAQTGDPTGAGDGGSSIWGVVEGQHKRFFESERLPKINHTTIGLVSLVGASKRLVGSQFFFTLGENLSSLDDQHCVIGEVVEGHDVLRHLNEAIVDENFRPYQDIRITHTVILEDPFPDPRGFREPSRSPSPNPERLQNGRIAADEDIDDTEGKSLEEIREMLAEREAKARATILEIVGDLPDAEMAPPENVLFVCKLNPVTTDDDLEIIFSRFGKVKSCEVIRDRKTGDSLQYAFVEFEEQKSCEAAYFKMDNVLIDDRRIHVDFSQSVSKVKWRGKGRGVEGDIKRLDFNNLINKSEKYYNSKKDGNINSSKRNRRYKTRLTTPSRSASGEKPHTLSVERRRDREVSRRDEVKRRRKSRSVSRYEKTEKSPRRSRSSDRDYKRKRDRIYDKSIPSNKYESVQIQQRRFKSPNVSRVRDTNPENISANRKREESHSPERRRCSSYRTKSLQRNNEKSGYRESRHTSKQISEKKRVYNSPSHNIENSGRKQKKHKKKEHKKKSKKIMHERSSSSDSSSSSDAASESSKTSSSDSSSKDQRKKKLKKSKKNKLRRNKSKKHKK